MDPESPPSSPLTDATSIEVAIEVELPDEEPPGKLRANANTARHSGLITEIRRAVRTAAELRGFVKGRIGVLVTDDETIREINLRHLDHDYATDVISFTYGRSATALEGELVVSLDTAVAQADRLAWDWRSELLLYVVHGTLHISGLEDSDSESRAEMRSAERRVLAALGVSVGNDQLDPLSGDSP